MTPAPRRKTQKGFSLLELLVAMTILAVMGTVGFRQFKKHSAQARYLKAQDDLRMLREGLDQYHLRHGFYPELSSYEAMVEANSPLVKESLIPANASAKDPWSQPYEGRSNKGNYELKCGGDPGNPDDFGHFAWRPGELQSNPSAAAAAPAPGAAK